MCHWPFSSAPTAAVATSRTLAVTPSSKSCAPTRWPLSAPLAVVHQGTTGVLSTGVHTPKSGCLSKLRCSAAAKSNGRSPPQLQRRRPMARGISIQKRTERRPPPVLPTARRPPKKNAWAQWHQRSQQVVSRTSAPWEMPTFLWLTKPITLAGAP